MTCDDFMCVTKDLLMHSDVYVWIEYLGICFSTQLI